MTEVHVPADALLPSLARGLVALRLNQHFPSAERLAALVPFLAHQERVRVDPHTGLPLGGEWARLDAEHGAAGAMLAQWTSAGAGGDARRQRLAELGAIAGPPIRELHLALRSIANGRASLLARIDRIDLATGTIARYTLVVSDTARGDEVAILDDARRRLGPRLDLLADQDAGVAFALLREQQRLDVEEIVRGVVGPLHVPDAAGPADLTTLRAASPVVSACLERASIDLRDAKVDDPLARSVVLAAPHERFGVSRHRKWAAARGDVPALKAWLEARQSRNLVYGW